MLIGLDEWSEAEKRKISFIVNVMEEDSDVDDKE